MLWNQKELPSLGSYGSGLVFLSQDPNERIKQKEYIESICLEENKMLFFGDVPINDGEIGPTAKKARPFVEQLFISSGPSNRTQFDFERKLFVIRKLIEHGTSTNDSVEPCYFSSLSSKTFCYKGMLLGKQLRGTFPDLNHQRN